MIVLDNDLNSKQKEAVNTINGPIIVYAGAGSGKTKTLTYRVANLLNHGIKSKNILSITFTNKARDEMKLRLLKMVGADIISDITVCTFHSLCAKILRKEIQALGYSNDFNIIDENEQSKLLQNIIEKNEIDIDLKPKQLQSKINSFKCYDKKSSFQIENDLIDLYNGELKKYNILDYEDLLLKVKELFISFPDVLKKYQDMYQHILIDEFQDTNIIQFEIIKMLANEHRNIFVVGDDNQSIYAFRGSNKENIKSFKNYFSEYKEIVLDHNYRSTQKILDCAYSLIKNNGSEKLIYSDIPGNQYDVMSMQFDNELQEASFVINEVKELIKAGVKHNDIAVLYRSNLVLRNVEIDFIKSNIPTKIYGSRSYLDRKEIKDMIAYFKLIGNPNDLYAFERIVNIPNRKIGQAIIDKIISAKEKVNIPLMDIVERFALSLPKDKCDSLMNFKDMILKYNALVENIGLVKLYDQILTETDYIGYIENSDNFEDRIANLNDFKIILEHVEKETIIYKADSINYIFDDLLLAEDKKSNVFNKQAVLLSTIHSSKGLEFDYVFIIGMEEGIFPNSLKFVDEEDTAEDRRVCYVAITRAIKKLYMTCAKKRLIYGKYHQFKQSRFIEESLGELIGEK